MLSSTHLINRSMDEVKEAIINVGATSDLILGEAGQEEQDAKWTVGIFRFNEDWLTVLDSANNPRGTASCLAHQLQTFCLAIMLDEPLAWCFSAFNKDELVAHYKWEIPLDIYTDYHKKVHEFEKTRLAELGVQNLDKLKNRNTREGKELKAGDPRVEQHYRNRISEGGLELPDPRLPLELPRLLHKMTGKSTANRIRRILSTPRINVESAVSEFSMALNLPNWIDESQKGIPDSSEENSDCCILRLFDKTS